MRILILLLFCCTVVIARAQGPAGYWLSQDKTGFFEGLESVEMRVDPSGSGFSGSIYYLWEHGIYYQAVSLEGRALPGDSIELREVALVANRNGIFPNDCRGIFHLHYSRDDGREYLTGLWRKPAGTKTRCADTRVTFFRQIPPDAPWAHKPTGNAPSRKTRVPVPVAAPSPEPVAKAAAPVASAPVAAAPVNEDSVRFASFKSRRDSVEMIVNHHSDSARVELYDNGLVDHDRVSLFLGDSLILRNYELLATVHAFTLHLDHPLREQVLSLFAENLGDIPPNTALMVIYIDDQRVEVRLSADLITNARVVFRRLP